MIEELLKLINESKYKPNVFYTKEKKISRINVGDVNILERGVEVDIECSKLNGYLVCSTPKGAFEDMVELLKTKGK